MTPSIDERREAAERLRYIGRSGGPEWGTAACCIAECVGEDDYPLWGGSTPLFEKLADLIEPLPERTCRNTAGEPFAGYREFGCSECGAHLEVDGDTDANLLVGGERPMPNYCPNCGAKVEVGK